MSGLERIPDSEPRWRYFRKVQILLQKSLADD